jgi:excisionase family DNA binding protein
VPVVNVKYLNMNVYVEFEEHYLKELREIKEEIASLKKEMFSHEKEEIPLTPKQTAEKLNTSLPTLHKWKTERLIPAYRIGRKVFYKKSDIINSLDKVKTFRNLKGGAAC